MHKPKMEELVNGDTAAMALQLIYRELEERYTEAQKDFEENPEDDFNSGRSMAYIEIIDIINNRVAIVNAPYGDD